MKFEISGRHIDIGEALQSYAREKIEAVVEKYFEGAVECRVAFSRDAHWYVCDCVVHLRTGLTAKAQAKESEIYAACDQAITRLEKQLRRHKRRLKDHHQKRKEPVASFEASSYVLSGEFEDDEGSSSVNGGDFWQPAIVAETKENIPSLTVGEAVMQMELQGAPFVLFLNDAHQRLNAVYRREDGAIGWIDPSPRS